MCSVTFGYPFMFGYYPFGFGYPISHNSIPIRVFCNFGSDFGLDFLDRVRIRVRFWIKCAALFDIIVNMFSH